ncbi:hypothetical protein Dimus_011590 [Dionaea muscipula]
MTANIKFELSSDSPEDSGLVINFPNGQRGNYTIPSLDRSGSFRASPDSRTFSYGTSTSKGNASAIMNMDFPMLLQYLVFEPITLGDQKYAWSGELRRALGSSLGSVSEDGLLGASHSKLPSTMPTDELKRFRTSVLESYLKARNRVKKLDECVTKLIKFCESLNHKKLQTNERTSGSGLLKMGTQAQRNSQDLVMQKLDDRGRNATLSKRARTPISDMRTEARTNGIPRQHLILGKDKDSSKEGNLSGDPVEERIRRLPAGGEGWDKKMKRKRSVSNVFPRLIDGDVELKRAMSSRLCADSALQSSEAHGFRSGSYGASGTSKPDGTTSPASSSGRMTPKNEMERVSLSRESSGVNKDRLLQKGNTKSNVVEDSHMVSCNSVTKAKASRAHRTGPAVAGNSSPNFSRVSMVPEDWEAHPSTSKAHPLGGVNRKRPTPTESSSPPMAQWVGQRPQKISRTRRANIISPTNHDELQVSSEVCTGADLSTRISSGANSSLPSARYSKVKIENAPSPARLPEGEETGIVENKLERVVGGPEVEEKTVNGYQHVGSPGLLTKKSKLMAKEEIGDGVRRQGRSGRSPSFSRGNMSFLGDKVDNSIYPKKMDNSGLPKPLRCTRPGSEKNGSRSGRPPLKKHPERKGFTRFGLVSNVSSPDFTGESDDDREELLAAAQFARNASYQACNSSFWKKMEPLFSIRLEDQSFLNQQLKSADEHQEGLSRMIGIHNDIMEETYQHQNSLPEGREKNHLSNGFPERERMMDLINQFQFCGSPCEGKDCKERLHNVIPLYQTVLSALIVEDEFEESEDKVYGVNGSLWYGRDNTSTIGNGILSNGYSSYSRCSSIQVLSHDEMWDSNFGFINSEVQTLHFALQNDLNGSHNFHVSASGNALPEHKYEQMSVEEKLLLELQSVGVYPEKVPDLAEGDDELINQNITQLKKQLYQQTGKKKAHLERLHKASEHRKELEGRDLEHVAMNRLVELAYRKLLATRGSYASRVGVIKVPRNVSLAFIKRTLSRCRKFEDTSISCFSEPTLGNILLAGPTSSSHAESANFIGSSDSNHQPEAILPGSTGAEQLDFRNKSSRILFEAYEAGPDQSDRAFSKQGPILNRGKKKEVLLDDVGGIGALRSTVSIGNTVPGGMKGKRSERDREKDLSGNSVAKAGRATITTPRGDRRTKSKPKQKAGLLSTHPVFLLDSGSNELVANVSNRKGEGLTSPGSTFDSAKESKESIDFANLPLHELDSIEDLSVDNEFGGHQDISSWLNLDEDNLLDHDSMGLEIPMDDLSELNMIL